MYFYVENRVPIPLGNLLNKLPTFPEKKKVELIALVFQLVVGPFKGKSKLYVG